METPMDGTPIVVPSAVRASLRGLVKIGKGVEKIRPSLRTVHVRFTPGGIVFEATDSYIAARLRVSADVLGPDYEAGPSGLLDVVVLGTALAGTASLEVVPGAKAWRIGSTLVPTVDAHFPQLSSVWNDGETGRDAGEPVALDSAQVATLFASVPKGLPVTQSTPSPARPVGFRSTLSRDGLEWSGLIMPRKDRLERVEVWEAAGW